MHEKTSEKVTSSILYQWIYISLKYQRDFFSHTFRTSYIEIKEYSVKLINWNFYIKENMTTKYLNKQKTNKTKFVWEKVFK